jgi:hypothetical protein
LPWDHNPGKKAGTPSSGGTGYDISEEEDVWGWYKQITEPYQAAGIALCVSLMESSIHSIVP